MKLSLSDLHLEPKIINVGWSLLSLMLLLQFYALFQQYRHDNNFDYLKNTILQNSVRNQEVKNDLQQVTAIIQKNKNLSDGELKTISAQLSNIQNTLSHAASQS